MSATKHVSVLSLGSLTLVALVLTSSATHAEERPIEGSANGLTTRSLRDLSSAEARRPRVLVARQRLLAVESDALPAPIAPPLPEVPPLVTEPLPVSGPAPSGQPSAHPGPPPGGGDAAHPGPHPAGGDAAHPGTTDQPTAATVKGATTAQTLEQIKALYGCSSDQHVLCINSCDGSILAQHDGATASFVVPQNTTLLIKLVGLCVDIGSTYTPNVTYYSDPSSVLKTPDTGRSPASVPSSASLVAAGVTGTSPTPTMSGTLSLLIDSTEHFAHVTVTRQNPTKTKPVDPSGTETGVDWGLALADYTIQHGRYYLDFGVGVAIVAQGTQTISAIPYRGDSTNLRLSTETSSPPTPLFTAFVYPFGHLRDAQQAWQDGYWGLPSLLVLEVGTELSRQNLLRSIYLGAGIEPVTGVNVVVGEAFVPVTVYQAGARDGLLVQSAADVPSLTRSVSVWRFFFAISVSTQLYDSIKSAYNGVATGSSK